jgi:hypothetical protein
MTDVVQKMNYSHEKLIDALIANPRVTQRQLAGMFGYSEGWLSQIVRSDGFRELYESRRKELVDPTILESLENRFAALTSRSIDILLEDLDMRANPEVALKALSISAQAQGYGARGPTVQLNQSFVVAMPEKSVDSAEWIASHAPRVVNG